MESTVTSSYDTWQSVLAGEKEKPYFKQMMAFLNNELNKGKIIYPPRDAVFNAIRSTPFDQVKVVIIGQDPYHGKNQAHGLCFSVQKGVPPPPSLVNIFKELKSDLNLPTPSHGNLEKWAQQGVLLLNTVLTVEAGNAHSHAKIGWETFTDRIIQALNEKQEGLVFLLWGSHAQRKCAMIDPERHFLLKAPHPSPLSAHRGFLGCRHFSQCNAILQRSGKQPIDWGDKVE